MGAWLTRTLNYTCFHSDIHQWKCKVNSLMGFLWPRSVSTNMHYSQKETGVLIERPLNKKVIILIVLRIQWNAVFILICLEAKGKMTKGRKTLQPASHNHRWAKSAPLCFSPSWKCWILEEAIVYRTTGPFPSSFMFNPKKAASAGVALVQDVK